MADDENMHAPTLKYELNLNTIIQVAGFLVIIAGGGAMWASALSAIDRNASNIEKHSHSIETLRSDHVKMDNLAYRMTVVEQSQVNQGNALEQLRDQMGSLQSDLRVIREILARVEKKLDDRGL